MTKEEARLFAKQYRDGLALDTLYHLSMMITYRLCYIYPFKEAHSYHFFVGSESKKEIVTKPLIQVLINAGKAVFVPKVSETGDMHVCPLFSLNDLKKGAFGIEEPTIVASTQTSFDVIVVPSLAADISGNRVGYGKGFYDRFLSKAKGVKIGIVYDACLVDSIETDSFDIPLDIIVTEKRVVEVNQK